MTERTFNLVVSLAHKATAMRTTDTAGCSRAESGAALCLSDRARLANAVRYRGHSVNHALTKTYRRSK